MLYNSKHNNEPLIQQSVSIDGIIKASSMVKILSFYTFIFAMVCVSWATEKCPKLMAASSSFVLSSRGTAVLRFHSHFFLLSLCKNNK